MIKAILAEIAAYLKSKGHTVDPPGSDDEHLWIFVEGWDAPVFLDIWGDTIQLTQERRRKDWEAIICLHDPDFLELIDDAIPASPSYD